MLNVLVIAFGLAMDSFSASLVLGGNTSKRKLFKTGMLVSGIFGLSHILMITLGFIMGEAFESFISGVDHWIAFALLIVVGLRMIINSLRDGIVVSQKQIGSRMLLTLALATSIDALILGMGIVFMEMSILITVITVGVVVFFFSLMGFCLGLRGNGFSGNKTGVIGGGILILMGIKILVEHLFL